MADEILVGSLLALLPAVILFFDRGTLTIFEPDKLALFRGLTLLLVGSQIVAWILGRQAGPRRWPLAWPTAAVLAVFTLSTLASIAPHWSVWGTYERGQGLLTLFGLAAYSYLIYHYHQTGIPLADRVSWAVVGASVPVVAYALCQAAGLDPLAWQVEPGSPAVLSTLGRSNYLAAYLAMAMPFTVSRWLACRGRVARFLLAGLLLAQGGALLLSRSRGGCLAVGLVAPLALAVWGMLRGRRRWVLGGVGLLLVGVCLLVALNLTGGAAPWAEDSLLGRLASLHLTGSGSVAARLAIWRASLVALSQRPFLGHGPATFSLAFARVYPPELVYYQGRETVVDHAHNEWLTLGVEQGLLGVIAYLWLQLTVWVQGLRRLGSLQPGEQAQQLCLLSALLANTAMAFIQPPTAATLVLAWTLYSLVLPPGSPAGQDLAVPRVLRPWAAVAVSVLTVAGLWLGLRHSVADHLFLQGMQEGNLALVEQAESLAPAQDAYYHQAGRLAAGLPVSSAFAEAEHQFLRAVELCPAHPLYWADLGTIYLAWAERDATMLAKAEAAFGRALAINPEQALWLRGMGRVYLEEGRDAEAEAMLLRVVALDATDGRAYTLLGDLYLRQGRLDQAIWAYERALVLWPESPLSHAGFGRTMHALGRCADAVPALERALSLGASGPEPLVALAECYAQQGDRDSAARIAKQGLSLYPSDPELQRLARP